MVFQVQFKGNEEGFELEVGLTRPYKLKPATARPYPWVCASLKVFEKKCKLGRAWLTKTCKYLRIPMAYFPCFNPSNYATKLISFSSINVL